MTHCPEQPNGSIQIQAPLSGDEFAEQLSLDELGDEKPVAGAGPVGPEDLDHVRMTDLPQRADLAAHFVIAGRTAVFPGVVGGSAQVFLAAPYMILYRVDRGRPAALLRDLRPSPGDPARRGPEINSTPLASPGTVASLSSLQGAHEIRVRPPRQFPR